MTESINITAYDKSHARKLNIKDDLIKDFPEEAAVMISDIKDYWKRNVNKYFSKSSNYPNAYHAHRLEGACEVSTISGSGGGQSIMTVDLEQILSPSGYEYGKVLIKGRKESESFIYVPALGASIDINEISYDASAKPHSPLRMDKTTKGTDSSAWRAWKREFNSYVKQRSIQFVRQCIKKGLIRRTK